MSLHDLTPQLRTRLNRVERGAGVFVGLALLLLLAGFLYYLHHTATRKGWFLNRVRYWTYVETAQGLKVGDPVKLMGFDAGQIVRITGEDPSIPPPLNVYIEFLIRSPYYGYIWFPDSLVRVTATDLLGNRYLEVTKGGLSGATNLTATYKEEKRGKRNVVTGVWNEVDGRYHPYTPESKPYYLVAEESPAITERLQKLASMVETALPDFLQLTNHLTRTLVEAQGAASNAAQATLDLRPSLTNLHLITQRLTEPGPSLGEWLIPTQVQIQLTQLLSTATLTLTNANTNLVIVASNLTVTLENLADLTANLARQAQANTNFLGEIAAMIIHTDELVQGLKRHWFLRGSFRPAATNKPPRTGTAPRFQPPSRR